MPARVLMAKALLAASDTAGGGVNSGVETSARMFVAKIMLAASDTADGGGGLMSRNVCMHVCGKGIACSLKHRWGGGLRSRTSARMFLWQR